MDPINRLLLTIGIIFTSLASGWLTRRVMEKSANASSIARLDGWREFLQWCAIFFLLPLAASLSLWGLPQPRIELLGLPFLGLMAYIWGGGLSVFAARLLKMDNRRAGSFFCCGTFTNIGAVGGLVSLLFLGENTIALVALYRLLEEIYYFSIAFPVAKWFASPNASRFSLRSFSISPTLGIILLALSLGIILNLLQIPRPEICGLIASTSMILATIFFLFTIGITLHISRLGHDCKPALILTGIKFFIIPMLIVPLAILFDYGQIDDGLPLKTVLVLSSMPVAMTALIPPSLFGLDVDLANACWIYSTLGLLIWLPLLLLILPKI